MKQKVCSWKSAGGKPKQLSARFRSQLQWGKIKPKKAPGGNRGISNTYRIAAQSASSLPLAAARGFNGEKLKPQPVETGGSTTPTASQHSQPAAVRSLPPAASMGKNQTPRKPPVETGGLATPTASQHSQPAAFRLLPLAASWEKTQTQESPRWKPGDTQHQPRRSTVSRPVSRRVLSGHGHREPKCVRCRPSGWDP